ncbi:LADA_0G07448g1_1 [Lachancea dasiensis]|uniref:Vacuolar protein sorting-associated protein 29 n=1 Tax=Lachancea dasiensis TaxID=1072105 RepID=A0A1G4JTM0_9SACH|nr:LADA_0G07448g1_1 [Lachancea dasiensis]
MLLLALSDAHIPERAIDLPHKFKKLIGVPNKIQQVVLLGNCTKSHSFLQFVNQISPNVVSVRGEFDNKTLASSKTSREEIPLNTILKQGDFTIGCCNGYTIVPKSDPLSLLTFARQLNVDIVLWGGTHNVEAYTLEGKFFINPGTCTGAFSADWPAAQDSEPGAAEQPRSDAAETTTQQASGEAAQSDGRTTPSAGQTEDPSGAHGPATQPENSDSAAEPNAHPNAGADDFDEGLKNVPSFCLLDIQGSTCTLYIYTYVDDEVKVDKIVYNKG